MGMKLHGLFCFIRMILFRWVFFFFNVLKRVVMYQIFDMRYLSLKGLNNDGKYFKINKREFNKFSSSTVSSREAQCHIPLLKIITPQTFSLRYYDEKNRRIPSWVGN